MLSRQPYVCYSSVHIFWKYFSTEIRWFHHFTTFIQTNTRAVIPDKKSNQLWHTYMKWLIVPQHNTIGGAYLYFKLQNLIFFFYKRTQYHFHMTVNSTTKNWISTGSTLDLVSITIESIHAILYNHNFFFLSNIYIYKMIHWKKNQPATRTQRIIYNKWQRSKYRTF